MVSDPEFIKQIQDYWANEDALYAFLAEVVWASRSSLPRLSDVGRGKTFPEIEAAEKAGQRRSTLKALVYPRLVNDLRLKPDSIPGRGANKLLGEAGVAEKAVEVIRLYRLYELFRFELRSIILAETRVGPSSDRYLVAATKRVSKFLVGKGAIGSRDVVDPVLIFFDRDDVVAKPLGEAGIAFEEHVADRLRANGFVVERTSRSHDKGADLIGELDGLRYAIQCKEHSKPIGVKGVQEAVGARAFYSCDYAVLVTSSSFTAAAYDLAREAKCSLLHVDQIDQLKLLY